MNEEKEIKVIQIEKTIKLSLFADDLITYKENLKTPTKNIPGTNKK